MLSEALQEASEGYCTEIDIQLLQDGSIRIADNGRGIPLTQNRYADKDVLCFKQDYVRGIPQHEISSGVMDHISGTEITLQPDRAIFGDTMFSLLFFLTANGKQFTIDLEVESSK